MNALETDPLANVVEIDAGPGQRLRQGREHVNLSIEEVAARLHLDTRTVRCLEADQYEELPAPTFVRGYLRSYARLLNLAAQPIIDAFDRRGLEPPALIPDISTSEETTSTDAPMRLATASIIIMLLAGVVLWWNAEVGTNWLVGSPDEAALTTPAQQTQPTANRARHAPTRTTDRGAVGCRSRCSVTNAGRDTAAQRDDTDCRNRGRHHHGHGNRTTCYCNWHSCWPTNTFRFRCPVTTRCGRSTGTSRSRGARCPWRWTPRDSSPT